MNIQDCIEDILVRGLDDWIQAAEIASVARTIGGAQGEDEARELSFRALRVLLERDLIEVGMVTEAGFSAWDLPKDQALERIRREWCTLPKGPGLGEVCWLSLTENGALHADALWSKKGSP